MSDARLDWWQDTRATWRAVTKDQEPLLAKMLRGREIGRIATCPVTGDRWRMVHESLTCYFGKWSLSIYFQKVGDSDRILRISDHWSGVQLAGVAKPWFNRYQWRKMNIASVASCFWKLRLTPGWWHGSKFNLLLTAGTCRRRTLMKSKANLA